MRVELYRNIEKKIKAKIAKLFLRDFLTIKKGFRDEDSGCFKRD